MVSGHEDDGSQHLLIAAYVTGTVLMCISKFSPPETTFSTYFIFPHEETDRKANLFAKGHTMINK